MKTKCAADKFIMDLAKVERLCESVRRQIKHKNLKFKGSPRKNTWSVDFICCLKVIYSWKATCCLGKSSGTSLPAYHFLGCCQLELVRFTGSVYLAHPNALLVPKDKSLCPNPMAWDVELGTLSFWLHHESQAEPLAATEEEEGPGLEIISNSFSPGMRGLCLLVTVCVVPHPWPWGQEDDLGHCCDGRCSHIHWHNLCYVIHCSWSPHTLTVLLYNTISIVLYC